MGVDFRRSRVRVEETEVALGDRVSRYKEAGVQELWRETESDGVAIKHIQ